MSGYREKLARKGHGVAKCGIEGCIHDGKNLWRHPGKGPMWLCDSCYGIAKDIDWGGHKRG